MTDKIFQGFLIILACFSLTSYADTNPLPMNKVTLSLVREQWATTSTAKVTVEVAAVLDSAGLSKTHKQVNSNLQKISSTANWHISQFNRSKDPSGLEKVDITAEARIAEGELSGLRDRAEKVSHPGEKYTISEISFTPSLADLQRTTEDLRNQVYQQASLELARLNKVYGDQKYFLHSIDFLNAIAPMQKIQPRTMMATAEMAMNAVEVSANVTVSATVVFAAKNS